MLLALWELGGRTLVTDPRTLLFLPLPSTIAAAAWALARDGSLLVDLGRSGGRVLVGSLAAVLVGVPLGAVVASWPRVGAALDAPLRLVRPIPPIAWVPLTILWFGVGELQQVVILFFAAAFVVMAGTTDAVRGVPPTLLAAARNLGVPERGLLLRVSVPAALPGVAAAVREGVGTAWFVLVAAEFLSASEGLGVLILEGRDLLEPARTFVGMGALAACGAATDLALGALQARLTRWT
ncbi:MAG: ABC transporter permease [Pseudomonadota bacterium]|nr:ABC transporter permease [Pseudomonadota bacterium]